MNIPMVKVPTFTMTLPVSGESIDYRPFVVKEEKMLILANEENNINDIVRAISDVVYHCTFEKMKLENYCLADMQYAFLQIRSKSIGTELSLMLVCGECGGKHPKVFVTEDFQVVDNKGNNKVVLDNEITVELKYPGLKHYAQMFSENQTTFDSVYEMITECIVKIYSDEEMFINEPSRHNEVREFVDNLTPEQFEKFEAFFLEMPMLIKREEFVCTVCGTNNALLVDSLKSFF